MDRFQLRQLPTIAFGVDRALDIGQDVESFTRRNARVLVTCDAGLTQSGTVGKILGALEAAGHRVQLFSDIQSDPLARQVDAAAEQMRAFEADIVVAIGGGSTLDLSKYASAIAGGVLPAAAYAMGQTPFSAGGLPTICVPTTAGTGAEVTSTAIISLDNGDKVWAWGDQLQPKMALLDPALTVSLPPHLTAATGVDAMVHAIEACTNTNAFAANDIFCHEAIRRVSRSLRRAVAQPENLDARGDLLYAATLAGIGIENTGTAVAHSIGHALAELAHVHHGRAVAIGLAATLPWSMEGQEHAFDKVANAMGLADGYKSVPDGFRTLTEDVGIDLSLAPDGLTPDDTDKLAERLAAPENAFGFAAVHRPITDETYKWMSEATLTLAEGRH